MKKKSEKIKKKILKKTKKINNNNIKSFGLFIGRFQPFHLGHLRDVKKALSKVDFLIILIGSAQHKREVRNPLSAAERKRMIRTALTAARIQQAKYAICQVNDLGNHNLWVENIIRTINRIKRIDDTSLIFVGTESSGHFTARLLAKKGYNIIKLKLLRGISGTKIRRLIRENKRWQHLVPKSIVKEIKNKI
ncbi:TPA: adenylyltransferase/cytidyltransferase family protein [Candidatus Woesearchaeota archaeon]|nr:adenylyltransferase/cytidyltransferase family protein [Candidatus Woesearchaeota archaeon]